MKLIAATALALAAADERAFADKADFITRQEAWWYNKWWAGNDRPADWLANSEGAIEYFKNYAAGKNNNFANKMSDNMQATLNLAKYLNQKCEDAGKPEYAQRMAEQAASSRKRRGKHTV